MRVGFTGTLDGMTEAQVKSFCEVVYNLDVGADKQALDIVDRIQYQERSGLRDIDTICHPPSNESKRAFTINNGTREPKPYLERNQDIVDEVELLIACPKEQEGEKVRSGTRATVRMARRRGIPIVIIRPDGKIQREGV